MAAIKCYHFIILIEHFPTKQGLRLPRVCLIFYVRHELIEHFPTKQGLRRHATEYIRLYLLCLIEHFPTKQGLRLIIIKEDITLSIIIS